MAQGTNRRASTVTTDRAFLAVALAAAWEFGNRPRAQYGTISAIGGLYLQLAGASAALTLLGLSTWT